MLVRALEAAAEDVVELMVPSLPRVERRYESLRARKDLLLFLRRRWS